MKSRRGLALPKMVFLVMTISITTLALMGLSLHTYAASRQAGERLIADQLLANRLLLVQTQPGDFAPPTREVFVEELNGQRFSGEVVTQADPAEPRILSVDVTVNWNGHQLRRSRKVSLDA